MPNYTDRRERDRATRRHAANQRVGHEHAYMILYGAPVAKAAGLVALAGGCVWAWSRIDHRPLAIGAGALGGLLLALYAASTVRATSLHARQMAQATGRPVRPVWWHAVAVAAVLLLGFAWVAMP